MISRKVLYKMLFKSLLKEKKWRHFDQLIDRQDPSLCLDCLVLMTWSCSMLPNNSPDFILYFIFYVF